MKKLVFLFIALSISMIVPIWGTTVYAADSTLKIQQNGVVKRAKEIGSGNGITFTLPDLSDSQYMISSIELGIFEKKQSESNYTL